MTRLKACEIHQSSQSKTLLPTRCCFDGLLVSVNQSANVFKFQTAVTDALLAWPACTVYKEIVTKNFIHAMLAAQSNLSFFVFHVASFEISTTSPSLPHGFVLLQ